MSELTHPANTLEAERVKELRCAQDKVWVGNIDGAGRRVSAMRNAAFGESDEALADGRSSQFLARMYRESLEPQAEATLHAP